MGVHDAALAALDALSRLEKELRCDVALEDHWKEPVCEILRFRKWLDQTVLPPPLLDVPPYDEQPTLAEAQQSTTEDLPHGVLAEHLDKVCLCWSPHS